MSTRAPHVSRSRRGTAIVAVLLPLLAVLALGVPTRAQDEPEPTPPAEASAPQPLAPDGEEAPAGGVGHHGVGLAHEGHPRVVADHHRVHLDPRIEGGRRLAGQGRSLRPEVDEVLLVLDATVGQNALSQVELFRQTAGVTGLVMTKLDGTARGGILVALAAKFGVPVHFIGVGEAVEDLEPFAARDFARAIAGLEATA